MPASEPSVAPTPASAGQGARSSSRLHTGSCADGTAPGRLPTRGLTGPFRSLFVVGRGGMGSIEVAVETTEDGAERIVALKRMLPSAVLDKRLTEMFLREAKLASM